MKRRYVRSSIFPSRIRTVSLIKIGNEHYGKKKFDSKGEETPEIGTEILFENRTSYYYLDRIIVIVYIKYIYI